MFNQYPVTRDGKPDTRYRIAREYCGAAKPLFVLRFCDEFVASSAFYTSIAVRAVGEAAVRNGAATYIEKPGA